MLEKEFNLLVLPSVANMSQVIAKFNEPVTLTKGRYKDIRMIFRGKHVDIFHRGMNVREFSFVWLSSSWGTRDLAYAVRLYLQRYKIPYTYVEKGTSKITDHMVFALNGIPAPTTLFFGGKEIDRYVEYIGNVCGYPLIVKDCKGSRGAHSVLIMHKEEFLLKMKSLPKHKKYMFQTFIPNDYDWGVMVANGKVVSGEKSFTSAGEFRNNACNGATEIFVDPSKIPQNIKDIAIKVSSALGLAWSRTDIIIDKHTQKPFVMEVNRLPGITALSSEVEGAYAFLASQLRFQNAPNQ